MALFDLYAAQARAATVRGNKTHSRLRTQIRRGNGYILKACPNQQHKFTSLPGFGLDNLRTINGANWRAVIHRLIELTPLVIVDARFPTPQVCEEITHLLDERRVSKTIFVVNEDGSAPGIEEAGVNVTDLPLVCCPASDLHIVVTRFRNTLEISAVTSKQA